MSDQRITELLDVSTPLAGTEPLPIVQSNLTKQATVANLTEGRDVTADSFSDSVGTVRGIQRSGSAKTSNYVLQPSDNGQYVEVTAGGSITIPDNVFSTGDVVTIINSTGGGITLYCSITTAYITGVDSNEETVTLLTRGAVSVYFLSGTTCVVCTANATVAPPTPAPPPPPPPPPTPSPAVAISDQTALNYSQSGIGGSATATYRLGNDGIAKATNVSGVLTAITGEWLVTGSASDFEAYMSAAGGGSGGSTGGTFNSWVSLGTTRDWTLTATNNYAVRYLTLQIRVVATGTILDTATITLEVDSAP